MPTRTVCPTDVSGAATEFRRAFYGRGCGKRYRRGLHYENGSVMISLWPPANQREAFLLARVIVLREGASSGIMVLRLSFGPMGRASGCGLLPAKCVWRPLAASQMLCLPHPRVGKIRSHDRAGTGGSGALRTAGRCSILGLSCFVPRPPQTSKFPSRPPRKALGGVGSLPLS